MFAAGHSTWLLCVLPPPALPSLAKGGLGGAPTAWEGVAVDATAAGNFQVCEVRNPSSLLWKATRQPEVPPGRRPLSGFAPISLAAAA